MAAQGIVLGIPPAILNLVQNGLLERAFHDALVPLFLYRQEALFEEWKTHVGAQVFMSRPGLLQPVVVPQVPGQDPVPVTLSYEQWLVTLQRWTNSIDTHRPTSALSMADQLTRDIQQLGINAAQSVNRIARNALFAPYLSGQTASTVQTASTDTQIQVASVNGFTTLVTGTGSNVRPTPVSSVNPLSITINGGTGIGSISASVIGVVLNNPSDPNSPGVLLLSGQVGAIVPIRSPVVALNAPTVIRSGGGLSIDALSASDLITLADINNAVQVLRTNNVQPHEDGWYHGHLPPIMNAEIFNDPAWQKLNTALPDHPNYKQGWVNPALGVMFFNNTESPNTSNVFSTTNTTSGQSALYAYDIGAEIVNAAGLNVNRTIITGKGALIERGFDENQYIDEIGMPQGKVGDFDIVNSGISISTEMIRLYIRGPMDRLGDTISSTWSISTGFAAPSDVTALSSPSIFKRAVCIESA
jgi:hypothetical protein